MDLTEGDDLHSGEKSRRRFGENINFYWKNTRRRGGGSGVRDFLLSHRLTVALTSRHNAFSLHNKPPMSV